MGFLDAVGRTHAVGDLGNTLADSAVKLGQMQVQGAQQNFANTIGLIDAEGKIQAINKQQQEMERLNKTSDVDELIAKAESAGHGQMTKRLFGFIESTGGIDVLEGPDGSKKRRISRRTMLEGAKQLQDLAQTDTNLQIGVAWDNFLGASQRRQMTEEALAANKKTEQAKELQAALDKAKREEDYAAKFYQMAKTGKSLNELTDYQRESLDIRREDQGIRSEDRAARLEETARHNREVERLRRESGGGAKWTAKPTDRAAMDRATTDAFAQFVLSENDRLLGTKLTPAQIYSKLTKDEKEYKARIAKRAWGIYAENEGQIAPSDAVQQAMSESPLSSSKAGPTNAGVSPPAGYRDSGRTSGGKKVYVSPDGKTAWVAP